MTRPIVLLLAAALALPAAAIGSDDPPVVLVVPPKYKKYEDHLPNHLDVFRADGSGKKVALKVSYGSLSDAFRLKTTRVVVVLNPAEFGRSPRKTEYNGFGGIARVTTNYTVHFRPDATGKSQQILSGTAWTDHYSPGPFQDGYVAHLKVLPNALNAEIGRAFFAKVAAAKVKDVRDPDRAGGYDRYGGALSDKAYALERVKDRGFEFVKLPLDNKLPMTVGFESLELINAVTGKSLGAATPKKRETITVDKGRILEVPCDLPKKFAKEDLLMRADKFFVVVPE
jgi:hypothetical protein